MDSEDPQIVQSDQGIRVRKLQHFYEDFEIGKTIVLRKCDQNIMNSEAEQNKVKVVISNLFLDNDVKFCEIVGQNQIEKLDPPSTDSILDENEESINTLSLPSTISFSLKDYGYQRNEDNQSSGFGMKKLNNFSIINNEAVRRAMGMGEPWNQARAYNVDLALEKALATIDVLNRMLKEYRLRVMELQDQMPASQPSLTSYVVHVRDAKVQTDKIQNFDEHTRIPIRSHSRRTRIKSNEAPVKYGLRNRKTVPSLITANVSSNSQKPKEENFDDVVGSLKCDITRLKMVNQTLKSSYLEEKSLREAYYNKIQDFWGKIRVYARIRPMKKNELNNGNSCIVKQADNNDVSIESIKGRRHFQYDHVFTKNSSQEEVYSYTRPLIQSVIDGYNICLFAYGQTGSGKTYTMMGDNKDRSQGIAPRAFTELFQLIDSQKEVCDYKVETYMLELYNDKLLDLLIDSQSQSNTSVEIYKDKNGMVYPSGATMKLVKSSEELLNVFNEGRKNRHISSTKMNNASSRSHCIVGVVLRTKNRLTNIEYRGKLSIVDLAGSERQSKSGAENTELKEANSINKSLSALGDVISALVMERPFIPYRNNKLTMLMQDSLGGNAKTIMFVNVSPAENNRQETISSLEYASRVKQVINNVSKNVENSTLDKKQARKSTKKEVKFVLPGN